MSSLSDKVLALLREALPYYKIVEEHHVYHHRHDLFFDFYMPELRIFIEVQGKQHFTFNSFHFSTVNDFKKQKVRDVLKEEWCEENGFTLISLKYDIIDKLTAEDLRKLIINN